MGDISHFFAKFAEIFNNRPNNHYLYNNSFIEQ